MTSKDRSKIKLLLLLAAGFALLMNFPILRIFNKDIQIGGIPLLYLYIFGFWLLTIILLFVITRKYKKK